MAPALFVPWPQPLAVGMVLGVAVAAVLPPTVAALLGVVSLLVGLARQLSTRAAWASSFDPSRPA
ncbi:MAG: hypothetical protein WDA15_10375, partial [Trueperaceae bacterium]